MSKMVISALEPKALEAPIDAADKVRQAALDEKYKASRAAFDSWETARTRTDQHLYTAIGRLAEFAAAVGNNHQALIEFAEGKGIRATRASTPFTLAARLMVPDDRKKASKYAMVLQLAARRGVEAEAESVAEFIRAEGGIEASLRSFRGLPRESGRPKRGGRPSAFGKAVDRMRRIARIATPSDLEIGTLSADYFLVIGVRHADGTTQLLSQPVTDEQAIRRAVVAIVPKGE
jgi:hypothetical protein